MRDWRDSDRERGGDKREMVIKESKRERGRDLKIVRQAEREKTRID